MDTQPTQAISETSSERRDLRTHSFADVIRANRPRRETAPTLFVDWAHI